MRLESMQMRGKEERERDTDEAGYRVCDRCRCGGKKDKRTVSVCGSDFFPSYSDYNFVYVRF